MSEQPRSRSLRSRLVALVVVVACVGGMAAIVAMLNHSAAQSRAAGTASDLQIDLGALVGMAFDLTRSEPSTEAITAGMQRESEVLAGLASLEGSGFEPAQVRALSQRVRTFIAGFDSQRTIVEAGDLDRARQLALDQADTIDTLLPAAATLVDDLRRSSDASARSVTIGVIGLALALVAVVAAALVWEHRSERRHQVALADLRERMLRHLLATTAHDLRSPLTAVRLATDLLTDGQHALTQDGSELVDMISRGTDQLAALVEDVAVLGTVGTDGPPMTRVRVDVAQVLGDAITAARLAGCRTALHVTPGLRTWADPTHLRRIIDNVVSNAAKYGGPSLTIYALGHDDRVQIEIIDDGPGVPPEFAPRLFDPFARATNARNQPGTGLGLSIVRALTEANGGSVHYEPGTPGSRFVIDLPATDERTDTHPQLARTA